MSLPICAACDPLPPPPLHLQVEVARLEAAVRSINTQLGEAEADYLTGSERLAALRREVGVTSKLERGSPGTCLCFQDECCCRWHQLPSLRVVQSSC